MRAARRQPSEQRDPQVLHGPDRAREVGSDLHRWLTPSERRRVFSHIRHARRKFHGLKPPSERSPAASTSSGCSRREGRSCRRREMSAAPRPPAPDRPPAHAPCSPSAASSSATRARRRFRLGLEVARLMPRAALGPAAARARPRRTSRGSRPTTGETVNLAALQDGEVVYLLSESGGRLLTLAHAGRACGCPRTAPRSASACSRSCPTRRRATPPARSRTSARTAATLTTLEGAPAGAGSASARDGRGAVRGRSTRSASPRSRCRSAARRAGQRRAQRLAAHVAGDAELPERARRPAARASPRRSRRGSWPVAAEAMPARRAARGAGARVRRGAGRADRGRAAAALAGHAVGRRLADGLRARSARRAGSGCTGREALGGGGLTPLHTVACEEASATTGCRSPATCSSSRRSATRSPASPPPALQERLLPEIAAGRLLFCQGFSEPDAGSDLAALRTTAADRGDRFVVSGRKLWTSSAEYADWIYLAVRTGGGPRHRGLSRARRAGRHARHHGLRARDARRRHDRRGRARGRRDPARPARRASSTAAGRCSWARSTTSG